MPRPKKEKPNRSDERYEVKITIGKDFNNKPIRKSFYSTISKDEARMQAENFKVNQKASEMAGISFVDKTVTFEKWANIWLLKYKKGCVKSTTFRSTYQLPVEKHLIPYFGKAIINNIRPVDVKHFFSEKQKEYHNTTLQKMKICLMGIFEAAIDNDLCIKNPVKNITYNSKLKSKEKLTYSLSEKNQILKILPKIKDGYGIYILLELGLRCSELCGLKWGDIDFKNKTVHIQRACVSDNGKKLIEGVKSDTSDRVLPLSTALVKLLKPLCQSDEDFVFETSNKTPYITTDFTTVRYNPCLKSIIKTLPNIVLLKPHELRHTCGTLLYDKTKDIYAVSKFMGHADISTTASYYIHNDVEMMRKHLKIK